MDLKGKALSFFMNDVEEDEQQVFEGPRLVKSGHLNIMIRTPKNFGDVREYADSLISGSAIMVCFDAVDGALKNRIFDYMNGVSYIVGASVSRVNDDLLLYAPQQVSISKKIVKSRSWLD